MEDIGRLEHRHGVSSCYGKAKQYLLAPADWRGLWIEENACKVISLPGIHEEETFQHRPLARVFSILSIFT